MSDQDHNQELPDPVIRNAEAAEAAKKEKDTGSALDKLLGHIQKDEYIPWEKVQLPSKGLYYDGKIPDGWLRVKPMGVAVDKMLTNQRLIANGEILNKVLESCTELPDDFNIREMLSGDFNFLLYYLRGITHGPEYEFAADCPNCKSKNMFNFDLGELSSTVTWANEDYSEEPFEVELPMLTKTFGSSVKALVRMIRVDDVMKMASGGNDKIYDPVKRGRVSVRKKKEKNKTIIKNQGQDLERIYEDNMKSQIVGLVVDGQTFMIGKDSAKIHNIIGSMHQRDAATIRQFLESVSPGIDTALDVVCENSECQQEFSVNLPFNENFFRPNSRN